MASDKIGVEMGQKDVLDLQGVLTSERQVDVDIALRIDDRSDPSDFVTDQVGGMGEAIQIKLLENHA